MPDPRISACLDSPIVDVEWRLSRRGFTLSAINELDLRTTELTLPSSDSSTPEKPAPSQGNGFAFRLPSIFDEDLRLGRLNLNASTKWVEAASPKISIRLGTRMGKNSRDIDGYDLHARFSQPAGITAQLDGSVEFPEFEALYGLYPRRRAKRRERGKRPSSSHLQTRRPG